MQDEVLEFRELNRDEVPRELRIERLLPPLEERKRRPV